MLRSPLLRAVLLAAASASPLAAQTPTIANVAYGPHERNVLDVYLATSPNPTPVAIFIHGGGFVSGDKSDAEGRSEVRQLLAAGVSVVAINYRYLNGPAVALQDCLRDCGLAVQYVRWRAADWNINPHRVAMFGSSAGGGASLWLATHPDLADPDNPDPVLRQSTKPVCVGHVTSQLSYDVDRWREVFGAGVVSAFGGSYSSPTVYGYTSESQLYTPEGIALRAKLDMYGMISPQTPPVFVACSMADLPILNTSILLHHPLHARRVYERCLEMGVPTVPQIEAYGLSPGPGEPATWVAFALKYLSQPGPGELYLTFEDIPEGVVGREYPPFAMTVSGGQGPYTWSIVEGSLPPGLELSAEGLVTGLPTQTGTWPVRIGVTDSTGETLAWTFAVAVVTPDQVNLLLREDFEAHPLAAPPPAMWSAQATVIDGTEIFGSARVLEIHDATDGNAGYEMNLVASAAEERSNLHLRFDLRNLDPAQSVNGALHFSVGRYNASTSATLNANANRTFAVEFNRTGALNLRINGAAQPASFTTYDRTQVQSVEVFVNDHETESVPYVRPDTGSVAELGPNRVVVYVNGVRHSEATVNAPGGAGSATLGRVGFYCGTADRIRMAVDNLRVGPIPVPPEPVPLAWVEVAADEANLTLVASLPAGASYQLEHSVELGGDAGWTPVGAPVEAPLGGGLHTFYLPVPGDDARGFYRVRQLTAP